MNDLQARHCIRPSVSAPPPAVSPRRPRCVSVCSPRAPPPEGLLARCAAACRTQMEPTLTLRVHLSRRSAIHTLHLELHPAVFDPTVTPGGACGPR
eukprot:scaffold99276_cov63-Phaeocystis_antarctica.AAC.2